MLRQGTVVDATIIDSVNRPLSDKKREELVRIPLPKSTPMSTLQRKMVRNISDIRAMLRGCGQ
jgi:hypothetical protein